MDFHPFALVRPQSQLLEKVVRQFLASPRERLVFQRVDVLYTFALHDRVSHGEALELLVDKLRRVPGAFREVLEAERGLLPLGCAPRLLQALHRFPQALEAARRRAEGGVVDHLRENLRREGLGPDDVGALWEVALQCARGESVRGLLEDFPLREALARAGPETLLEVLSAVCAGGGAPVGARERLLKEVLGEDEAWRLCTGVLRGGAGEGLRERAALLRVLLAARRGFWPAEVEVWEGKEEEGGEREEGRAARQGPAGASPQSPTLNAWAAQVWALHQPCIPPALREVRFHQVMVQGLWQLYTTADCEVVVGFLVRGLPLLAASHPDFPWRRAMRRYHDEALLGHVEAAAPPSPLSLDSLVNLLVASAWLRAEGEGRGGVEMEVGEAGYLPDLIGKLRDALKEWLRGALPPSPPGRERGNPLLERLERPGDAVVRRVPLILAGYVVAALEKILAAGVPSRGAREAAEGLLELIREHVLRPSILDEHGCARVVAFLLLHAPILTQRLGLGQTCVRLLKANCRDGGFTRDQLEGVLAISEPGKQGGTADRWDIGTELRKDLREALEHLPVRGYGA